MERDKRKRGSGEREGRCFRKLGEGTRRVEREGVEKGLKD